MRKIADYFGYFHLAEPNIFGRRSVSVRLAPSILVRSILRKEMPLQSIY